MIGGKGESDCVAGVYYYTDSGGYTLNQRCVGELEKMTAKPHHIEKDCRTVSMGRDIPEPFCRERIVADEDCQKGALYDGYVGSNVSDAEKCAKELARITGKKHEAMQVAKRKIFADVYRVVASK